MSNILIWIAVIVAAVAIFTVWMLRDRLTEMRFKVSSKGAETTIKGAAPRPGKEPAQPAIGADGAPIPLVEDALQIARGDTEIEAGGPAVVRGSKQFSGGSAKLTVGRPPPSPDPPQRP